MQPRIFDKMNQTLIKTWSCNKLSDRAKGQLKYQLWQDNDDQSFGIALSENESSGGFSTELIKVEQIILTLQKLYHSAKPFHAVALKELFVGKSVNNASFRVLANHHAHDIDNQIIVGIVEMLLLTGARKGEVLNLKWSDLDENNHLWKLNENKSGKPRIIQLNSQAQQIIRRMSRKYLYVFANPKTGLPFNDIRKTFQKILDVAQIENFRIHDLRHNFASMAVNNGCDIYVVQHLLGHASPTTTQRYAHLRQDTLRNASEMLAERINSARPNL